MEKDRDKGIAVKEEGRETAGTRKTGIVVDLVEAEEMPRVTAAIVTVVNRPDKQHRRSWMMDILLEHYFSLELRS